MPSVDTMSQADLARLTRDTHRVTVQYRLTASSEDVRIIKKNVSAAVLRAFSGYCKDELDFDDEGRRRTSKAHTVDIVGGNFSFLKLAFEFIVNYCDDRTDARPMVQGPPLRFWGWVHEAAEQMEVPVLERVALGEFRLLLEPVVTVEDARLVIQAFTLGTVCSDLVLDNLADAILNSKGGWHFHSPEYQQLGDSEHTSEIEFYQILKGCVDGVLWKREEEAKNVGREAEEKEIAARQDRGAEVEAARAAAACALSPLPTSAKVVDGNIRGSTKEAPKQQKKKLFRRL